MAVAAHDSRDYAFARHFNLPVIPLIEGADVSEASYDAKEGTMMNSEGTALNLNGLSVKEAMNAAKSSWSKAVYGESEDQLPLARRDFQPPALLGRTYPHMLCSTVSRRHTNSSLWRFRKSTKYLPTESGEPPLVGPKSGILPKDIPSN